MIEKFKDVVIVRKLNDANNNKVTDIATEIEWFASCHGVAVSNKPTASSIIIAVGGDGTMLEAMRLAQLSGAHVIGINLGNVGFLTELSANNMDVIHQHLRQLFSDNWKLYYTVEYRWAIKAKIRETNQSHIACNEISVAGEHSDEMIKYRLLINGHDAGIHRANSILVATPTGSTAYSMSAGGALMMPNMRALQVVPVAPCTLTSRPIIVSGSSSVQIHAWGNKIAVRLDGTERYTVGRDFTQQNPYVVDVNVDDAGPIQVVHGAEWNYFNVLTNKLGWIQE